MLKFPLVLKKDANSASFFDGWGRHYHLENDGFFHPVEPSSGQRISTICIDSRYVKILGDDHSSLYEINQHLQRVMSPSPDQKDKGIGITDDEEKAHAVVMNGDCSDGGAQESIAMNMQRQMEQNALTAGEGG